MNYQLFNKFNFDSVYILDFQHDTVLKVNHLSIATTDWFFLNKKFDIHYIVADDCQLKINKYDNDSTNIDYILKVLTSKSSHSKSSHSLINLQKIEFRNTKIIHTKNNNFKNTFQLSKANISFKEFNETFNEIKINDFTIDKLDCNLLNYKNENQLEDSFDINKILNFSATLKIPIKIQINNLNILKIKANEIKQNNNTFIDKSIFNNFSIKLKSIRIDSNKIQGDIFCKGYYNKLNINHLKLKFIYQNNSLALQNFNLKTNLSLIQSNIIIHPKLKINKKDYKLKHLKIKAIFSPSIINGEDLKYLLGNQIKIPTQTIHFKGELIGDIDSLKFENIQVSMGRETSLKSSLSVYNFLDSNKITISGKVYNLVTNITDLKMIFPKIQTYNLHIGDSIGKFSYQGKIIYSRHNLSSQGSILSKFGKILHNINFQFLANNNSNYKGSISTEGLNLNKWLNVNQFGNVDFIGDINGSGLNFNKLKVYINGKFSSFIFNSYQYKNLNLKGNFENKNFIGDLSIDDKNIKLNSLVKINLLENSYFLKGNLNYIDIKEILNHNKHIYGQSKFEINLTGNTLNNVLGSVSLSDIHIENPKYKHYMKTFSFKISTLNNVLNYTIESDILNGYVKSNLPLTKLVTIKNKLFQKYIPNLLNSNNLQQTTEPELSLNINVIKISPVLKIFTNDISGFDNSNIIGEYSFEKPLYFKMTLPIVNYNNLNLVQSKYTMYDSQNKLYSNFTIDKIKLNDTSILNNLILNSVTYNDSNFLRLKVGSKDQRFFLDFNTLLNINKENIWTLKQNPSILKIYDSIWNFDPTGEITYKKPIIYTKNISLENGIQKISLSNGSNFNRKLTDLNLNFNNVSLQEFTSVFFPKIKASGIIDGNIVFNKLLNNFTSEAAINIHNFKIQNDSLGLISIFANYDSSKKIQYEISSHNNNFNFHVNGIYNTKNFQAPLELTKLNFEGTTVEIIYPLLKDFFSEISGTTYGFLNINGSIDEPNIEGQLKVINGEIGVSFNKVNYYFDTAIFNFNPDNIIINPVIIKDKFNNKGEVYGNLKHNYFKKFSYNITILSNNILVLNSIKKSNDNFYGTVFGKINFSLTGNDDNLNFNIDATTGNNTKFFIQNIDEKEFVEETFIKFKSISPKAQTLNNYYFKTNYSYNLNLKVLNNSDISVILDDDDIISGSGHGDIVISGGNSKPVSIRGVYNIDKGKYDINFQSLLRTSFEILPNGNNFIEWADKPLEANINIEAVYKTQPVSITDLVGNSQFSSNIKSYKGPVYIVAVMKEKLNNPKISFRLDFPPDAPILTNNDFNVFLKQLEQNENEILKQVGFLILFQSFAPIGNIAGNFNTAHYNYSSIGYNTLSKIISNQLNALLNNLLNKISKDKSFSFDFGTSFYNSLNLITQSTGSNNPSTSLLVDRNLINFKVSKSFFNDKLILSVNPGIDFNLGSTTYETNKLAFLPNVNAEVDLTKDKKLKLIIFTNSSLDYTGIQFGRRNRQGIRFTFQKDFN